MDSVNRFCYLKGLVACDSGRIQDCNMKRLKNCPLENKETKKTQEKAKRQQAWCYLKGLVDCEPCDVQDCNIKRVRRCPLEKE